MRYVNLLLALLALLGAGFAIRAGMQYRELERENRRLRALVSSMEITDRNKAHLFYLGQSDPFTFRWRMYWPYGGKWLYGGELQDRGTVISGPARQGILTVRVLPNDTRRQIGYVRSFRDVCRRQVEGPAGDGYETVMENWDQLTIEVAGRDRTQVFRRDQLIQLISIKIPPHVEQKLTPSQRLIWQSPLLDIKLGATEAIYRFETRSH